MKLYVDLETLDLIGGPGFRNPISALRFKRGDAARLEVVFLAGGVTPASIGDPATLEIQFGIKPRYRYDVGYLCHTTEWTLPAPDATSPVYQCSPSFNTVELDSALGVGSSTGTEQSEITLMGEITWREGTGQPTSTRTFFVIVENDVNRGTEGVPTNADPPYPAPLALALLSSVVRHDAAQSLSTTQQSQARSNIGLSGGAGGGAGGHPTDAYNLNYGTGLSAGQWAVGAKMLTVSPSSPFIMVKTTTGYAKLLRWDGTFAARSGTGVPGAEFTLTVGAAPVAPYNSRLPKFMAVFPCDAGGAFGDAHLTSLVSTYTQLTALNVRGLSSLVNLNVSVNELPGIDLSGLSSLTTLTCDNNFITSLNLDGAQSLTHLTCAGNPITSLDLSAVPLLTNLSCSFCNLTSLDPGGVPLLTSLDCSGNNLGSLDVSGLSQLSSLSCASCNLTSLIVRGLAVLSAMSCDANSLTSLDLSGLVWISNISGMSNILSPSAMDDMFNSLPAEADDNEGMFNMSGTGEQTATEASLAKRNAMISGGWTIMIY